MAQDDLRISRTVFPKPSDVRSEDERFIEEEPARKEAALMREQGEIAAGLRKGYRPRLQARRGRHRLYRE